MQTSEANASSVRTKLIPARDLLFFALVAAPVLVCWREILTVLLLAWHVDEYTHILLIVPVSVALIYLERGKLRRNAGYAPIAGMLVGSLSIAIMVGLKTHMLGSGEGSLTIAIFSLVLFWMAAIVGCFGMDVFRALMFPFLFLFLLVPPPMFVLDKAILFLQSASTVATYDVFKLTGLPVLKSGFILTFPTLQIEVAKECSGIRSSIMLLLTGLILAHLFLRSFWSKVVFVLLILPLSVIKNAIRIFTLSMLGMYVDPGFLRGRLHHEGGIVFFLIALAGLLFFLWILQRAGGTRAQPDSSVTPA